MSGGATDTFPEQVDNLGPIINDWRLDVMITDPAMWEPILVARELMAFRCSANGDDWVDARADCPSLAAHGLGERRLGGSAKPESMRLKRVCGEGHVKQGRAVSLGDWYSAVLKGSFGCLSI